MSSPDTKAATPSLDDIAPTAPAAHTPFFLPPHISYTCNSSGVCCTTFDTIPVTPTCADALANLTPDQDASIRADANASTLPFVQPAKNNDPPHLTRKADCSCVFFDKDRLCAVHRILGESAKPQVCRDFPYRYVETPGGIYVGLSFVCPSVRGNIGTPVVEQEQPLRSHYTIAQSILESPQSVALNRRIELTWPEYLELETALFELLDLTAIPFHQRLIACCGLVNFIDTYYNELLGKPAAGPGNRFAPGALKEFLDVLRAAQFAPLIRVATRPRKTSPMVKRMFLGMFTSFANTLHRTGGRALTVATVLAQYAFHASGIGGVRLKPLPVSLSHNQLRRAQLPADGSAAELLERYVRHAIFRKDLVLSTNVSRRLRLLVLNVALIPWYAMAEAAQHNRDLPLDADYSEAIAHIEKFYGFHSRFYRFFEENPAFDDIVEAFMLKPNYPFLLLNP